MESYLAKLRLDEAAVTLGHFNSTYSTRGYRARYFKITVNGYDMNDMAGISL